MVVWFSCWPACGRFLRNPLSPPHLLSFVFALLPCFLQWNRELLNFNLPSNFGIGCARACADQWVSRREMAVGNTFGATALSSYGGFWISFAIVITPGGFAIESTVETADKAAGLFNEIGIFLMVSPGLLLLKCEQTHQIHVVFLPNCSSSLFWPPFARIFPSPNPSSQHAARRSVCTLPRFHTFSLTWHLP